jgi:hypothetical protein
MAPVPPYIDTESGLLVQALDAAAAMRHVDTFPCLVHLLPQFRVDALSGFATGKDKDIYLSGSWPRGEGAAPAHRNEFNGLILYSVEKGRRNAIKLVCRLLCLENRSIAAGRALLIPAAIMHKAQRIEAKVNKKDMAHSEFWTGLGFELHDDVAEMEVDTDALANRALPAAPTVAMPEPAPAAAAPLGSKKRGRPPSMPKLAASSIAEAQERTAPPRVNTRPSGSKPIDENAAPEALADDLPPAVMLAQQPSCRGGGPQCYKPAEMQPQADAANLVDEEAPENPTDVYIRKKCPGGREPHLISTNAGELPTNASVWHLVPEPELEAGHTVQCLSCRRVFLVARDQAESVDATL